MGGWIQEKLYEVLTASETEACPTLSNGNLPWRVHNSNSMPTNSSDLMKKLVHSPSLVPTPLLYPQFPVSSSAPSNCPTTFLCNSRHVHVRLSGTLLPAHRENVAFKNGGWILNCSTSSGKNLPSSRSIEFCLLNFVLKKCTQFKSPNIIQYNIISHLG